jgi:hypothetical protein
MHACARNVRQASAFNHVYLTNSEISLGETQIYKNRGPEDVYTKIAGS